MVSTCMAKKFSVVLNLVCPCALPPLQTQNTTVRFSYELISAASRQGDIEKKMIQYNIKNTLKQRNKQEFYKLY